MALTPSATAASYNPLSGLSGPPAGIQRSGGSPTAPTQFVSAQQQSYLPSTTATAPPSPTSPSPSGGSNFTPDWASLIANDPALLQAMAALNASGSADKTALGAEIANAYEGFGKPIDLTTLAGQLGMSQADIGSFVGPDAQRIAKENTDAGLSTVSRLDAANQLANHQITADLNKRGILNSGETAYQLDHQNTSYRQAQSDAYQKFLGYLQQYQSGYLAAQEKRAEAQAQAYSDAADRQFSLWGNSGGGGGGGGEPAPVPTPYAPPSSNVAVGGSLPGKVGGGFVPFNPFGPKIPGFGR